MNFRILSFFKKGIIILYLLTSAFNSQATRYTFYFSGQLTQVIDNYSKLNGTGMMVGSPFTGHFTYETTDTPWFTPPWTGNYTYEWVRSYRFIVHTTQGDYEFGYIDSSRAFFQVDVRNYDKLWWGQSGINSTIAKTDFPSQKGTYAVGFNLSNTPSNIWSVAYPLPVSLNVNDFDFTEVSFIGYDNANQIDYRVVGHLDYPSVPIAGNNSPCIGDTLQLTANTISGATYLWSGPDGFSSTLQNPVINGINVSQTGAYSVTATTIIGSASATTDVYFKDKPSSLIVSNDTVLCSGTDLQLFSTAGESTSYTWNGPDSFASLLQNPWLPNTTVQASGIYTVTAENSCGYVSADVTVIVNPTPVPEISGDSSFCPQGATLLDAGNYESYLWFPGGETSASITTSTQGTYSVNVTNIYSCSATSLPVHITMQTLAADFNIDGTVDNNDFLIFIAVFNQSCTCPEDLDRNGIINTVDFLLFLGDFNKTCE